MSIRSRFCRTILVCSSGARGRFAFVCLRNHNNNVNTTNQSDSRYSTDLIFLSSPYPAHFSYPKRWRRVCLFDIDRFLSLGETSCVVGRRISSSRIRMTSPVLYQGCFIWYIKLQREFSLGLDIPFIDIIPSISWNADTVDCKALYLSRQ